MYNTAYAKNLKKRLIEYKKELDESQVVLTDDPNIKI